MGSVWQQAAIGPIGSDSPPGACVLWPSRLQLESHATGAFLTERGSRRAGAGWKQGCIMKILVLGGSGMLGHKMLQTLRRDFPYCYATLKSGSEIPALAERLAVARESLIPGVDAMDIASIERVVDDIKPDWVINCVGIIKQRAEAKAAIASIAINALLPHRLADLLEHRGARLIHFSTDCVFSGKDGNYLEDSFPDAYDLYGRTKYLGEVAYENSLTLRTSIIGRELSHHRSLLDWFLAQNHKQVRGYRRAFYSGVTTNHLSQVVARIIQETPQLHGVYQVTGNTIHKFDLLTAILDVYGLDIELVPDDSFFCDRSMSGAKFDAATGHRAPAWAELVAEIADDPTTYESMESICL